MQHASNNDLIEKWRCFNNSGQSYEGIGGQIQEKKMADEGGKMC